MMMKTFSQNNNGALSERKKKKLRRRIEKLLHTLRSERNNYKLHIELGDSYSLLNHSQQAEQHYSSAIEILHQNTVDEKMRKQIIMLYGKILSQAPDKYETYAKLGEEYIAAGQKEKASRFLLSSAKKAFDNDDYTLALQCYNQIIKMGKGNPYIVERCTEIYLKLGQQEKAIENYTQIADAYVYEEKYIEALEYYKKANAIEPENPDLTLKIARMYYALEWKENAATELIKLAEYHEKYQNYSEALKYYHHILSLDRDNEKALTGKQRISEVHTIDKPLQANKENEETSPEDILKELDQLEDLLKGEKRLTKQTETPQEETPGSVIYLTEEEDEGLIPRDLQDSPSDTELTQGAEHSIDASELFSHNVEPSISRDSDKQEDARGEYNETQYVQQNSSAKTPNSWQDHLLDVGLEKDFIIEAGLEDLQLETSQGNSAPEDKTFGEDNQPEESEEDYSSYESFRLDDFLAYEEPTGEDVTQVDTAIEAIPEEAIADISDVMQLDHKAEESVQQTAELTEEVNEPLQLPPLPQESKPDQSPQQPESQHEEFEETLQMPGPYPEESDESPQLVEPQIERSEKVLHLPEPQIERSEEVSQLSEPQRDEPDEALQPLLNSQETEKQSVTSITQFRHKIESLKKQLQKTEKDKQSLQEEFEAQLGELRTHEATIQKEFETTKKDKEELKHRLNELIPTYEASRQQAETFDDTRYEAIITKIQHKKQLLQEHLSKLLKQREENGRFLAEELEHLGNTKRRLQNNLEYIQQVKNRVEEKVNGELRQAQQQIQTLNTTAKGLKSQLKDRKEVERDLQEQFERTRQEKDNLQDQFTETITALTGENENLSEKLKKLSKVKLESEKTLKKKLQTLHHSYQRVKSEHKNSIESKEAELNRTAQRLSEFADDYIKLEKTLGEIRKERDELGKMLVQETATRERLEEKLVGIESQVDSLESQGTELLVQLEQELDRQFSIKQSTSDEFQGSLEEFETLLSLQEQEIQHLETL